MKTLNENLLNAWLTLSTSVINNRVVSKLPYNESLICNVLYRHRLSGSERPLTATDLCNETKMAKSLMNRTLNQLESQELITRTRSLADKRQVLVTFNMEKAEIYLKQHQEILNIIDTIITKIGIRKATELITLFNQISNIADDILSEKAEVSVK